MCPTNETTGKGGEAEQKQVAPPDALEGRLTSQDKRIAYLIKKISRMEKKNVEVEPPGPKASTDKRLGELKRILADHGLEIQDFNEEGFIRLKPLNEMGFDTLRKLNTLFHVSLLESYFEEHIR